MSIYHDGTNAGGRNAPDSLAGPDLLTREEIAAVVELADEYTVNTLRELAANERRAVRHPRNASSGQFQQLAKPTFVSE